MAEPPNIAHDNPFTRDKNGFRLRTSVLCFIDILGFRETILSDPAAAKRLHEALAVAYRQLLSEPFGSDAHLAFPRRLALKAFTDNVVIAWPVEYPDDGEVELVNAFSSIGAFQTELAVRGFFVRGAISVGEAYLDDFGVFGPALLEAYEAERDIARDPRIVLCPSALTLVQTHVAYYSDPLHSPQNVELRRDTDGQIFCNYLAYLAPAPDEGGFGEDELHQHGEAVRNMLDCFKRKPSVWSKYEWVARYHNQFCEQYAAYVCDDHTILLDDHRLKIGDII